MRLLRALRALIEGEPVDAREPLSADAVRDWYASLTPEQRARWSAQIRGAQVVSPRGRTRVAVGRLLFLRDGPEGARPLHHMRVELWDRDPGGTDDYLGASVTDLEGRFEIEYRPEDAGPGDIPDLELRVMEPQHVWTAEGRPKERFTRVFTLAGPDDVEDPRFDFGDVRVPYWEYDAGSPIPRVHVTGHGEPPEAYAPGRSLAMFRAVDPVEIVHRKHLARIAMGRPPSLDAMQADYPDSLTTLAERANPGVTRTAAWLGERILNGFYSTVLDGDWDAPDDPRAFRVYHPWNAYEQDGIHCFPSVDLRLRLEGARLLPSRITLGFRERGATAAMSPTRAVEVLPEHGARWTAALRFARVSLTYDAELSNHLGQCHLNLEQYALAARRNLRASPLRWLLMPHLREVAVINHAADDFLIGPNGYVTRAGALTPGGVVARVTHAMGGFDWKGFSPQPPVCEGHRAAEAAALMWALLGEHVDAFLREHREGIAETWPELRRMSDDLVAHAVPRFACSFLRRRVIGRDAPFFARAERPDYGTERAVSAVTSRDTPDDEGWANLAQLCRYALFFATFRHAWANNLQWDDGGEVRYAALALRWTDRDPLDEVGDDALPAPREATEMLWISWLLSKTSYGTLASNEEGDVHPRLVQLVRARRAELSALGLDIDRLGARINI